ncbi:MAG: type II toxin-antitoxin system RelE/ParE family toxin, partial [Brachymonas sp.]|nr:type II toxin-antitoxin system RelE/ParE family toxin [Brachymonas sp.]
MTAMSMIYEVRWTQSAREDLVDIHDYYATVVDSKLADQILERIGNEVNSLQIFAMRTRPGRLFHFYFINEVISAFIIQSQETIERTVSGFSSKVFSPDTSCSSS